jgi:hypothetical protein
MSVATESQENPVKASRMKQVLRKYLRIPFKPTIYSVNTPPQL